MYKLNRSQRWCGASCGHKSKIHPLELCQNPSASTSYRHCVLRQLFPACVRAARCCVCSCHNMCVLTQAACQERLISCLTANLAILHTTNNKQSQPWLQRPFKHACAIRHAVVASAAAGRLPAAQHQQLKLHLGKQFPNSLLLPENGLPPLYTSKHFVNLTNGLEMAPLMQQLQLPFSVVRIRSTCLEQQAFESLVLELDANLLLALALGHSCIIWDCGCRNKSNGAPRAVWYGIEFMRFCLQRFWLGASGQAHLRGYNVSADFEAACRKFHPSTKKRLRYYQRYLTPGVHQHGVQLYGAFKRTERDEDVPFYVDKAWQCCGRSDGLEPSHKQPGLGSTTSTLPAHHEHSAGSNMGLLLPTHMPSSSAMQSWAKKQTDALGTCNSSRLSDCDLAAYELLLSEGVGMFLAGLSHPQFKELGSFEHLM